MMWKKLGILAFVALLGVPLGASCAAKALSCAQTMVALRLAHEGTTLDEQPVDDAPPEGQILFTQEIGGTGGFLMDPDGFTVHARMRPDR